MKILKRLTNFDKIKAMSVEELAVFLNEFECFDLCEHSGFCRTNSDCVNGIKKYLELEIE